MFVFDTGTEHTPNSYRIDRVEGLLDGVRDSLPESHTDAELYAAAMPVLRAKLCSYRMAENVRAALWNHASIMREMAEHAPAAHDELLLEILDRLDRLT